ncbi:FixH family protein [Erythrobacter sp. F6033]|uniref:FixH family protein n=1 Tax=Erythrobacter sp. F6033 TaxID=2926401 RepID=UPI001FF54F0F|nr:FixH family protein [Erythrobacter sp. F6033]MCK0127566.1 FixH family protein [Erythrobacter sp. F6033]
MSAKPTKSRFTGRHMAAILIFGFGIVVAVNFTMAGFATGGFHGVVVQNSYVASQQFNTWLEEAEADQALGWEVDAKRDQDGYLDLTANGVPEGALITAELRRPIGVRDYASVTFEQSENGSYRSTTPVDEGRWTIRISIEADSETWSAEDELR